MPQVYPNICDAPASGDNELSPHQSRDIWHIFTYCQNVWRRGKNSSNTCCEHNNFIVRCLKHQSGFSVCIPECFGVIDVNVGDGACTLQWFEDVLARSVWHVCFACLPRKQKAFLSTAPSGKPAYLLHKSLFGSGPSWTCSAA